MTEPKETQLIVYTKPSMPKTLQCGKPREMYLLLVGNSLPQFPTDPRAIWNIYVCYHPVEILNRVQEPNLNNQSRMIHRRSTVTDIPTEELEMLTLESDLDD